MSTPKTDIFRDRDLTAKCSADVNKIMSELLDSHEQLETEVERLREALIKIHDFMTGYDDVAGIVCKIARAALEPK